MTDLTGVCMMICAAVAEELLRWFSGTGTALLCVLVESALIVVVAVFCAELKYAGGFLLRRKEKNECISREKEHAL